MRSLLRDLAAILWPTECAACGSPDRDCCDACVAALRAKAPVRERSIGVPCYSAGPYSGPLRALLVEFKHFGRVGFARDLGASLLPPLRAGIAVSERAPIIVAAPSRPSRIRQRGYRHVELLISRALRQQRIPHIRLRALRARRGRTAQLGLAAAERESNARRVAVRRSAVPVLNGREVVLVDDVVTTGATLRAAREALEAVGATVVAAAVLCTVERNGDSRENEVAADSADTIEFGKEYGQDT